MNLGFHIYNGSDDSMGAKESVSNEDAHQKLPQLGKHCRWQCYTLVYKSVLKT